MTVKYDYSNESKTCKREKSLETLKIKLIENLLNDRFFVGINITVKLFSHRFRTLFTSVKSKQQLRKNSLTNEHNIERGTFKSNCKDEHLRR